MSFQTCKGPFFFKQCPVSAVAPGALWMQRYSSKGHGKTALLTKYGWVAVSHNKCCIGAGINPSERQGWREKEETGGGRWAWTVQRSAACLDCPSLWETMRNGGGGCTHHPEVGAHSACQDRLSCCIFHEESPVAYYNIYRRLKIAKWVFLVPWPNGLRFVAPRGFSPANSRNEFCPKPTSDC